MKRLISTITLLFTLFFIGLTQSIDFKFEPSSDHPFGLPNPEAPDQLLDFAPLIGECHCSSTIRSLGNDWSEPVEMVWRFKYIMNGTAIQDETLKSDSTYAGSIRQFNSDSSRWYVHYYSSGSSVATLPAWEGNKRENGDIVLYRDQKAPNGTEGWYKITFSDIDESGFKWLGEWVNKTETLSFPTWKIDCKKNRNHSYSIEKAAIIERSNHFSQAYISGDYDAMAEAYTSDAKIFPSGSEIISGLDAIKKRWTLTDGTTILNHQVFPEEIQIEGKYSYDYGVYEGKSKNKEGEVSDWKGKYVIVWKKENGEWKMYLDIWNRVKI